MTLLKFTSNFIIIIYLINNLHNTCFEIVLFLLFCRESPCMRLQFAVAEKQYTKERINESISNM